MTTDRPKARYKKPWDRAAQDKKRLADLRARRQPYIYFLRCREFIKIGWTTDINPRLRSVQTSNPDPVTLAAMMCGGALEEVALHRAFQPHAHRAEWFREEGPLAELISLIRDLQPVEARAIAGDWFLKTFGKLILLSEVLAAQNPDQGLRIQQGNT